MTTYHKLGEVPRKRHTVFRQPNGAVKTASQAVASLVRHFDGEMRQVKAAIGPRVSAAEPAVVPVDDETA